MANQIFLNGEDCFEFGKHKGKTFSFVKLNDPEYLKWAINNNVINISKELSDLTKSEKPKIANAPLDMEKDYAKALDDMQSFIFSLISQKLLIDSLEDSLNSEIKFSDQEEIKNVSSIKLTDYVTELYRNSRIGLRRGLLDVEFSKNSNELKQKIDILYTIALNDIYKETTDSIIYLYEEQFQSMDLLTIEVKFCKPNNIFTSLYINYRESIVNDIIHIDLGKLKF